MNTSPEQKSFWLAFSLSLGFLLIGFSFLYYDLAVFGWFIFLVLPLVVGMLTGLLPKRRIATAGLGLAMVAFLALLYLNALEGLVCIIMSLPIVIPLALFGRYLSRRMLRYYKSKGTNDLRIIAAPFLLFLLGAPLEKNLADKEPVVHEVRTEVVLPYTPMQVYEQIKSVDTLAAELPFLMKLDLPIPQKCILEEEAVGGIRTCYFSGGKIVERITELEPGKVLRMDVIDYQLTGRHWLGFKEAIYYFEPIGDTGSKLTRITTYTSILKPRFYWQPLEEIGIQQEHAYVIENLKKDLLSAYGKY